MKRKLRIGVAVVLGLLVLGGGAAALFIKPEAIKNEALARLQDATGYSIEAGEASLKFGLGDVGIRVRNVTVASPDTAQRLFVDMVDVLVKPIPLLRRRIELQRLVLHQPDYVVDTRFASPEETVSGEAALAVFAVESWGIRQGRYRQRAPWGELILSDLDLGGGFVWSPEQGGVGEATGTVGGGWLRAAQGEWPLPTTETRIEFQVAGTMDALELPKVELKAGPLRLALSAKYKQVDGVWEGVLEGGAEAASLDSFKEWFPDSVQTQMEAWMVSGTVSVPRLRVEQGRDGSITTGSIHLERIFLLPPALPIGVENASGEIHITPEGVNLESVQGKLGMDSFTASGRLTLGDAPRYKVKVSTQITGETLGRLSASTPGIGFLDGSLALDLEAEGAPGRTEVPALWGTVHLQGVEGTWRNLPLSQGTAAVHFSGRSAKLSPLSARLGQSDFSLQGTVADIRDPDMQFTLTANRLDLNELFPETQDPTEEEGAMIAIPGHGTLKVGTLRYRRMDVTNVNGKMALDREGIRFQDLTASLYSGTLRGSLELVPVGTRPDWRYTSDLRFQDVQALPLVSGWPGLGQVLEGRLSGEMAIHGLAGKGDPRRALNLNGMLNLTEGAVLNLPGLYAMAQSLNLKGVTPGRWPFQSLGMHVAVEEGRILLDKVQASQPGLGWSLAGAVELDGRPSLKGTVRIDPRQVTLPPQVSLVKHVLVEADGRIPVDFLIDDMTWEPRLDWASVYQRAKSGALQKLKGGLKGGGE